MQTYVLLLFIGCFYVLCNVIFCSNVSFGLDGKTLMITIMPVKTFLDQFFKIQGFKLKFNDDVKSIVFKSDSEILKNKFPNTWTVEETKNYLSICIYPRN